MHVSTIQKSFQKTAVAIVGVTFGLVLLVSPQPVFAASNCGTYGMNEDGDQSSCQISDCDQLISLANGADGSALARTYRLTADLTCPGDMTSVPIGSRAAPFTGTFDGDNHEISYLNIDAASSDTGGLFGGTDGATISDLRLFYTNISRTTYAGSLVGEAKNGTTIKNVHATDPQLQDASSNGGGLVGRLENSTISYSSATSAKIGNNSGEIIGGLVGAVISNNALAISNSYVKGSQDFGATTIQGHDQVGGLVGSLQGAIIENVYAQATISSTELTGGLVGQAVSSTIRNAYAAGSMSGTSADSVGGMLGDIVDGVTIQNTFAAVSGTGTSAFYGTNQGSVTLVNNLYDPNLFSRCYTSTDGQEPNCGYDDGGVVAGDWTNRSRQPMASWDTFTTWSVDPLNGSYPLLLAQGEIAAAPFDGGDGGLNSPYVISSCRQLQHMQDDLTATYTISGSVDCTESRNWNGGKGFNPVGDADNKFTGNLIGSGVVSDLYIDRVNDNTGQQAEDEEYVGMFGAASGGLFANFKVQNSRIRGYRYVGGIIGHADFVTISGVEFNSTSEPNDCNSSTGECVWARYGEFGGGIVGHANNSILENVHTGGSVKGSGVTIGGIAGRLESYGQLNDSSSSANIDGGSDVGGLVGVLNASSITDSTASGDILVQTDDNKAGDSGGGLVGTVTSSTISDSSATGDINGRDNIGGFVGFAQDSNVERSTASGTVSGSDQVGGFVGRSLTSDFSESDALGSTVIGISYDTGGFVGTATCGTTFSDTTASAAVGGFINTGGFAGSDGCQGLGATYIHATATGNVEGNSETGGLIGFSAVSVIDESTASGDVTGVFDTGGLIGGAWGFGRDEETTPMLVTKSFATGNVTGSSNSGGLVANLDGGVVSNSYSRGNVDDDDSAGGVVGSADNTSAIQYSYATGQITSGIMSPGGVVGTWGESLVVTSSFWDKSVNPDIQPSGLSGELGTGLTTQQLQSQSVLEAANYSFDDIWKLIASANDGYACFQWQADCVEGQSRAIDNSVTFISPETGKAIKLQLSSICSFEALFKRELDNNAPNDIAYDYPNGLVGFNADCGQAGATTTVTATYYRVTAGSVTLRKYNPTTKTYFTINDAQIEEVTLDGQPATKVTYQVTDGSERDADGKRDGKISDPAGLGVLQVSTPNTGLLTD